MLRQARRRFFQEIPLGSLFESFQQDFNPPTQLGIGATGAVQLAWTLRRRQTESLREYSNVLVGGIVHFNIRSLPCTIDERARFETQHTSRRPAVKTGHRAR